ncbi:MAG TPA: valine--tRNA ligase [Bacteroidales bacterium]|nr:MAG: valine--tRNA ligase [Bacteroidetes bacterium GWF2_33_38]OFY71307.1 MAG: valine--tRNA ligase [Bacteroidetes bacterium RIFOXYA12_FULL_33_9]HBF88351.1 valine--tRNA ligase [Bacteroidales bacterium]
MEIPAKYDSTQTEDKWYKYWIENNFFSSKPDATKEPYTIVIPPPNVTGVLHMGHMLNNTLQDVLIRRARMQGKNALWLPGTDHASIATEARVVAKLKADGIDKNKLTREEFMKHAWEWKEKHGGIILEQLKKLGASCDWSRTKFTMDDDMSESVIDVFIDLYNKGYIYRGVRMVNWDPQAKTAVSDEEVNHKEVKSKLYYVRYKIEGTNEFVTIATTRPETILGDTAVCVHPEDERYQHLKGKKIIIPLVNRAVPLIFDAYVDKEFGTGALKVTPAHDINDYNLGQKYNLETIDIFNDDGTLNERAELFIGKDRFVVRKEIVKQLEEEGFIVKIEDYTNSVGFSERTDAVIEPKLSMQWFLKMENLVKPALENVMNDNIKLHPAKFKNTYRHWMENVKDWCISRQLWWGQQIPAYYLPNNKYVVAKSSEEAVKLAKEKYNLTLTTNDIRQDEDVLDTWFSSWLWPISTFDGIRNPNNEEIKYYYPTNDLITAPEILFFWVARMIIAGYEYLGDKPFSNVYLTGIVRDKLGRKMSKSLGNSPDPIELMKKYGADGVRVGMLFCSPAGNDLPFDESMTEQGRNFGNKIWNAFRLVKNWEIDSTIPQPKSSEVAIEWFDNRLNQAIAQIDDHFSKYRISEALMEVYKLFWDEFSSWYLESIKPAYQHPIDKKTLSATFGFFDKLLKVLHPFMPFITEELWQYIEERKAGESIMISEMPKAANFDEKIIYDFEKAKDGITNIRAIRNEKNIPLKENLALFIKNSDNSYNNIFDSVILKLANLSEIKQIDEKPEGSVSFMVGTIEYFIPLGNLVNAEEEIAKLTEELEYNRGFLNSVLIKLSNEKFVSGAPAKVVEMERKKLADAESKIKSIEEQIAGLKKK